MRFRIQFSVEPKKLIIHTIIIFQTTKHLVYVTNYKVRKRIKVTAVNEALLFLFGRGCAHKTTDFFVQYMTHLSVLFTITFGLQQQD